MVSPTGERYSKSAQESRQAQLRREAAKSAEQRAEAKLRLADRIRSFEARLLPRKSR